MASLYHVARALVERLVLVDLVSVSVSIPNFMFLLGAMLPISWISCLTVIKGVATKAESNI